MLNSYAEKLRAQGYRMTPQRMAILRVLHEAGGHLAPIDVYLRTQEIIPGITETTVYRTLNFLTGQGLLLAAHIGSGQLVYEVAERAHHHLICRACGKTYEVGHEALKALYERLQGMTGFQIDTLHVTFFGLCPGCQNGPHRRAHPEN